ncbi:MAG: cytochrome c maturation protein CcmE [Deltaproteobacteria bacterium]|nr:cytochrome c maturation protein CcmE [Deltaproteobacteria bacterium]
MKRHYQFLIGGAIIAAILGAIVYQSFESTVFFQTPAEILADPARFQGKTVRIGALVVKESTQFNPEKMLLSFKVTEDNTNSIPVVFAGVKPDLFREGQGVVVEGKLDGQGVFQASNLLVKHSEEYKVDQSQRMNKEQAYQSLIRQ